MAYQKKNGSGWIPVAQRHPELGQIVLVFCQGFGARGRYWSDCVLAAFDRDFGDRRTPAFYNALDYKINKVQADDDSLVSSIWKYRGVTHWMPLPEAPERIKRVKEVRHGRRHSVGDPRRQSVPAA